MSKLSQRLAEALLELVSLRHELLKAKPERAKYYLSGRYLSLSEASIERGIGDAKKLMEKKKWVAAVESLRLTLREQAVAGWDVSRPEALNHPHVFKRHNELVEQLEALSENWEGEHGQR